MINLSAIIITRNEEKNIERCLASLKGLAHEIIVIDDFSTDRTPEICRQAGVRFYQRKFDDFITQKNFGISLSNYEWLISLDADEALSDTLKKNIYEMLCAPEAQAFYCNRRNLYAGQWIRFGGWYPDKQMRVWNRDKGLWGGTSPHETVQLDKDTQIGEIKGDIIHYAYDNATQHKHKARKYAAMKNTYLKQQGKPTGIIQGLTHAIAKFIKVFFLKGSFLDGLKGIRIAAISMKEAWWAYSK